MEGQVRTVEREMARIARGQHGVATRAELLKAGLTAAQIDGRVAGGSLIPQHRGVYRVGHCAPSVEARYLAAVRACGEGAVLSGRAAAHLLGLVKGRAPQPEVTAPTERRVPGVKTRRSRVLEATTGHRIPVTPIPPSPRGNAPPRPLVDMAADLDIDELARACHEAGVRYRTTPAQVEAVLARRPRSPGAGNLRAVMRGDARVTLSKLERRFLELLREHDLPLPQTNKPAGSHRVDCRWPEYRVT